MPPPHAAAASIGVIIPPSPSSFLASYRELQWESFVAGVIPGIIIGIALMIVSYFSAKNMIPRSDKTLGLKYFMKNFVDSLPCLCRSSLWGIYGGIFTPTAVVVVVYALFIGKFIYKGWITKPPKQPLGMR